MAVHRPDRNANCVPAAQHASPAHSAEAAEVSAVRSLASLPVPASGSAVVAGSTVVAGSAVGCLVGRMSVPPEAQAP